MAAAALLAFSAPVPAFSEMKEHAGGHAQKMAMCDMDKMGDMMDRCVEHADKMGFTDEQTAKMKSVHREMQKKQVRYNADLKIAEIELMETMEVKDFDLEKATSAAAKIGERKTAHHIEMIKAMKEVRAGLTDEQFKKMKKMMSMQMDHKKPAKHMKKK